MRGEMRQSKINRGIRVDAQARKSRKDGYLTYEGEEDSDELLDMWQQPMNDWMMEQMKSKLAPTAFSSDPNKNFPHFMFVVDEDINWLLEEGSDTVVLEVEQNIKHVVLFDDNEYVMVTNDICNGGNDTPHTYLANSEKEADEHIDASAEEKKKSWERMFDITRERDPKYCGTVEIRAMTPYISHDMVVAVYGRP
jgi:hypothetical protein